MSALAAFHWLRPWWLLALLPTGLLVLALWRRRSSAGDWQQVIDRALLPLLTTGENQPLQRWPLVLLAAGWLLAILALAGPSWQQLPQPVYQRQDALIIALDLSPSMYAQDLAPSRLEQAKREIRDILKRRQEGLTALIAYAGDAHVVVPLTDDTHTIELLLPALNPAMMPLAGSDPVPALQLAAELAGRSQAQRLQTLLITDGIYASDFAAIDALVAQTGMHLAVLGIGTAVGAPIPLPQGGFLKNAAGEVIVARLDADALAQWSRREAYRYHTSDFSDTDIDELLKPDAAALPPDQQAAVPNAQFDQWRDAGPTLALLLLPLALLAFRRGWLLGFALVVLLPPPAAQALSWDDLWQRPDQQGRKALEQQQPQRAAELFEDPQWQGVARYRAGDYPGAAEAFAARDDSDGHYNRGNALARAGDLPGAVQAYQRALELQPDHADAAANKAAVEALLQQQQQQATAATAAAIFRLAAVFRAESFGPVGPVGPVGPIGSVGSVRPR